MFTLTIFEIWLFEGRSALPLAQQGTRIERVKVSLKNQKITCRAIDLQAQEVLNGFYLFFKFCLTLSVPKKFKNSIFEMPISPQTSNINNLRGRSAKSINLHTIRKVIKYSLKKVSLKAMFTLNFFEILLEGRSVLLLAERGTKSEWVKHSVKN